MFQDLAIQAYAEQVIENDQAQQESKRRDIKAHIKKTIELFDAMQVKHDAAQFDETTGVVTLDGVRFLGCRVYGKCPKCNGDALSSPVWSLGHIGRMLTDFEPDNDHAFYQCPKRYDSEIAVHPAENVSTSTAQVLADALAAFMRDHGYQHIDF
jgi:hypothetical protein